MRLVSSLFYLSTAVQDSVFTEVDILPLLQPEEDSVFADVETLSLLQLRSTKSALPADGKDLEDFLQPQNREQTLKISCSPQNREQTLKISYSPQNREQTLKT